MNFNQNQSKDLTVFNAILFMAATFFCTDNFAGNHKTFGVSTRAQSMGGAFVAVADDAAAVFYNPAGLTQIKGLGFLNDALGIMPRSKYTNSTNQISETNRKAALGLSTFVAKRISEGLVLGLGLYTPFARVTSYPASLALMGFSVKSRVVEVSLTPVAAFKLTKKLSFGLGPSLNFDYLSATVLGFKQKADGYTVSGVFSLLYELTNRWKMGVTYHMPTSVNIKGHGRGHFMGMSVSDGLNAKYRNPGFLDVGTSVKVTDKLLLSLSFGAEFWNKTQTAIMIYDNPVLTNVFNLNAHDAYDGRVGLEYKFKENQALRLGYSYLGVAVPPEGILPGILDFNINVFSAGFSYYQKNWRYDLGFEAARAQDAFKWTTDYNPFVGLYQARLYTIWLGVNYQVS